MGRINSFELLKAYGLRRLGHDAIHVEITPDQQDDLVEDALAKFGKYHFEGFKMTYLLLEVTKDTNTYTLDSKIIAVTDVIPKIESYINEPTFNLQWEMAQQYGYIINDIDMISYDLYRMRIRDIHLRYRTEIQFDFNPSTHKISFWPVPPTDTKYMFRIYTSENPADNVDIYGNDWVKEYVEALFWRQWGANVGKYENVPLPGGAVLNGAQMYERGAEMKLRLEEELESKWGEPPEIMFG
jgi:hypothetical protein